MATLQVLYWIYAWRVAASGLDAKELQDGDAPVRARDVDRALAEGGEELGVGARLDEHPRARLLVRARREAERRQPVLPRRVDAELPGGWKRGSSSPCTETPHLGGGLRRPAEELPPHACEWLRRRSRVQPVEAAGGQMGGVLKQGEAACSTRQGAARGAAAAGASPRRLVADGETPRLWGGLR